MLHKLFNINFIYVILIAAEIAAIVFLCILLPSIVPVTAAVFAVVWMLNLIAGTLAYCKGASPEISCSVILLIIALPIAGALAYLFSALKRNARGILKTEGLSAEEGEERAAKSLCGTGGAGFEKAV